LKLSIIIPVLNEEKLIEESLKKLQPMREKGHELIVVDGGSSDRTCDIAKPLVDKLLTSARGRAMQMNSGAQLASGNILVFLHADTSFNEDITTVFNDFEGRSVWGRFDLALSGKAISFRVIEFLINLRSRVTGVATGDQSIFVSDDLFRTVGGYPEISLMEDIALSKKLKVFGRPICLKNTVLTSSRRWEENGIFRTIIKMWILRFKYMIGINTENLSRDYD
jgi:rSAM/selenodomain-associated transferase 2